MRIALISDIHANLDALTAVLEDVQKQSPDIVVSLGDQIGMGPEPTEVLDTLKAQNIMCLLGNHEMRVRSLWTDENPALQEDINYAFARWGAARLQGYNLALPMELWLDTPAGQLYLTHAGVGNPFARIEPEAPGGQKEVLQGLRQVPAALVAVGHSHYAYQFFLQNRPIVIVGSVGFSHNGMPGTGEYSLLEMDSTGILCYPRMVKYDNTGLFQAFINNRLSVYEPIMARVVWEAMYYNQNRMEPFVQQAMQRAEAQGEHRISPQIWEATARAYAWRSGDCDCRRFWGL